MLVRAPTGNLKLWPCDRSAAAAIAKSGNHHDGARLLTLAATPAASRLCRLGTLKNFAAKARRGPERKLQPQEETEHTTLPSNY